MPTRRSYAPFLFTASDRPETVLRQGRAYFRAMDALAQSLARVPRKPRQSSNRAALLVLGPSVATPRVDRELAVRAAAEVKRLARRHDAVDLWAAGEGVRAELATRGLKARPWRGIHARPSGPRSFAHAERFGKLFRGERLQFIWLLYRRGTAQSAQLVLRPFLPLVPHRRSRVVGAEPELRPDRRGFLIAFADRMIMLRMHEAILETLAAEAPKRKKVRA